MEKLDQVFLFFVINMGVYLICGEGLYQPCFLEGRIGAVLLDGFESASRNSNYHELFKLGNVNSLFLQIRIFPHHAGRIVLGCASAV